MWTSSEFLERRLAVMLAQEVEEALVVLPFHVEHAGDDLVVAARVLQPAADDVAHRRPRDLALHEQRVHRRPERLPLVGDALVEIVGDRAAPLLPVRSAPTF